MFNKITRVLLSLALLAIFFSSCSQSILEKQIQFGIQSAQRDLWDEAIFRWKKAVLSDPKASAPHNNLAVAYESKGLWQEAKKEYEIALKLDPKNSSIQDNYEKFKKNHELIDDAKKDKKK